MSGSMRLGGSIVLLTLSCGGQVDGSNTAPAENTRNHPESFAPEPPGYVADIGTKKQLFFDTYRVESMVGSKLVIHAGQKQGVVLQPTEPWESKNVYIYGSVVDDDEAGLLKMWYQTWDPSTGWYHTLYAVSDDGYRWIKPQLGVTRYKGSTANNIVLDQGSSTCVKDLKDPDPSRRYKMLTSHYAGYSAWFSPDGIRWRDSPRSPVIPGADVANVQYDPNSGEFLATTKQVLPSGRRVAFLSTSTNFDVWTPPKLNLEPDDEDRNSAKAGGFLYVDIYGMPIVPYEGIYVAFPWVFLFGPTPERQPVEVQIAFSRDLTEWTRFDRSPVIPTGAAGEFDAGMTFSASNVIIRNGEIWMYYGGWNHGHGISPSIRTAAIGLTKWRLDGFSSASSRCCGAGVVTTRRLIFEGRSLHVNADLSAGSMRVEVLDEEGQTVPGFEAASSTPIRGDSLDDTVSWAGHADLGTLSGKSVRLRFYLENGDLYSYWFE